MTELYDFTPNLHKPLGIDKTFSDGPSLIRVRCEYVPVDGCKPGELFVGYHNDQDQARDSYILLTVDELGDLIKTLKKIHKSWKAYEAKNGEDA